MTTAVRTAPSPIVPSRRMSLGSSWAMVGAFALLLGLDWLLPLSGIASYAITGAISVLLLPWIVLTLRFTSGGTDEAEGQRGPRRLREHWVRGFVVRLSLVFLTLAFLVAKWAVLLAAQGNDQLYAGASRNYTLGIALLLALGLLGRDLRASRFLASASLHPARLMALSFGGVGLMGTTLLSLPISVQSLASVSLVDNLFTAFSAVCVTGLMTVNLAETYSWFGQLVILILIQVGGLGIMVLSAAIAIMSGQKLRLKSSAMLAEVVDGSSIATLKRTVLSICGVTLLVEGIGAVALYFEWRHRPELAESAAHLVPGGGVWWAATFHSISAFCNAGLSTFTDGLLHWGDRPLSLTIVALLVVLGGLGFPVLIELFGVAWRALRRQRNPMLSLHSRVVLRTSAGLLAVMTVAYLVLEWTASLSPLGYAGRVVSSFFHAVVARTAGFNAVDMAAMLPATWFLTCVAMFIGAAPGSTGGGIKVTTLAALLAGLKAELRASTPKILNRTLPDGVVKKAIGVVFLSSCIVLGAFFLLLLLEPHPPLELAFEAVSAFSTTGLSTGITGRLSTPGKLLITFLMFIGRIGPLTLALAISAKSESRSVKLPEERVLIG